MEPRVLIHSPDGDFQIKLQEREVRIKTFCLNRQASFLEIYTQPNDWSFTEPEVALIIKQRPWVLRKTELGLSFFLLKKKEERNQNYFFQVAGLSFEPSTAGNTKRVKVTRFSLEENKENWSPGRLQDYYFFAPHAL